MGVCAAVCSQARDRAAPENAAKTRVRLVCSIHPRVAWLLRPTLPHFQRWQRNTSGSSFCLYLCLHQAAPQPAQPPLSDAHAASSVLLVRLLRQRRCRVPATRCAIGVRVCVVETTQQTIDDIQIGWPFRLDFRTAWHGRQDHVAILQWRHVIALRIGNGREPRSCGLKTGPVTFHKRNHCIDIGIPACKILASGLVGFLEQRNRLRRLTSLRPQLVLMPDDDAASDRMGLTVITQQIGRCRATAWTVGKCAPTSRHVLIERLLLQRQHRHAIVVTFRRVGLVGPSEVRHGEHNHACQCNAPQRSWPHVDLLIWHPIEPYNKVPLRIAAAMLK